MEEIRGVVWPVNSDMSLGIYKDSYDSVESSLRTLLMTTRGERFMEPNFGTNLRHILFEQGNDTLRASISSDIAYAINRYEKRIALLSEISVTIDDNVAYVSFTYCLKRDVEPKKFELTVTTGDQNA